MSKHFIAAFRLGPGKARAVLTINTDVELPGRTVHAFEAAPASLVPFLPLDGTDINETKHYSLDFVHLPGMLGELAGFLVPRVAQPLTLFTELSEIMSRTYTKACGNAYEDDGWYLAGADRLLTWMLSADNYGPAGSSCPATAGVGKYLLEFLHSPASKELLQRAHALKIVEVFTEQKHGCVGARNLTRAIMAMISEYQPWERIDPKTPYPQVVYCKPPEQGRGNLRRLAEYALSRMPEEKRPAYLDALAEQLMQGLRTPEPLPHAYPATRIRVTLPQDVLEKVAAR